ncbi:unnamed protein product [Effrenium voratum]|nr:unnamed protein product [Effrenium voratum]
MQEICSMAGFNIKAQIGELMLAANSLQQSNSHWYRDYHMFIPKTWKTSLDKFMGDYQEIPKSLVVGCIYLAETVSLADIVLNAVALNFVLDVDELVAKVLLTEKPLTAARIGLNWPAELQCV